jgi:isopentenyl-diphosphate delta-isomerase
VVAAVGAAVVLGLGVAPAAHAQMAVIDVAGSGGTSWSEVEYYRAPSERLRRLARSFADWGIPTAESLVAVGEAAIPFIPTTK